VHSSPRVLIGLALFAEWIATGGNFLAFKIALESFPPVLMMSIRLLAAGVAMLLVARIFGARITPSLRRWQSMVVSGVLLLVIGQGGIVWGIQHLPAGTTAVFGSSAPLFVAIFSWWWLRKRLRPRQYIGIAVGFAGLAVLALFDQGQSRISMFGVWATLIGSASWALGSLYEHREHGTQHTLVNAAVQMFAAGVVLGALALVVGDVTRFDWNRVTLRATAALAYLAIVGLVTGFGAFIWLNRTTSPTLANSFQYVSPVIALIAGAGLLDESLTPTKLVAGAITLSGVFAIVTAQSRSAT
jgi:drug/metabolite transporter (DMT)-like permease